MAGSSHVVLSGVVIFLFFGADPGLAATWRSPREGMTFVAIEKKIRTDRKLDCPGCASPGSEALEHLPPAVLERSGAHAIEYEGFLTTWLPEPAARALAEVARSQGLAVGLGIDRAV